MKEHYRLLLESYYCMLYSEYIDHDSRKVIDKYVDLLENRTIIPPGNFNAWCKTNNVTVNEANELISKQDGKCAVTGLRLCWDEEHIFYSRVRLNPDLKKEIVHVAWSHPIYSYGGYGPFEDVFPYAKYSSGPKIQTKFMLFKKLIQEYIIEQKPYTILEDSELHQKMYNASNVEREKLYKDRKYKHDSLIE
jgi:hypothetical protein